MIEIKSNKLKNSIENVLGTDVSNFSLEELSNIKDIIIDPVGYDNVYEPIDFEEVLYLKNIVSIKVFNTYFNINTLEKLNRLDSLKSISFYNCDFDTILPLTKLNIEDLLFNNCSIDDIKCINNVKSLKKLSLENFNLIDLYDITIMSRLVSLSLYGSKVINQEKLNECINLEYLRIDNTNITRLDIIENLPKIKDLVINKVLSTQNLDKIKKLNRINILEGSSVI